MRNFLISLIKRWNLFLATIAPEGYEDCVGFHFGVPEIKDIGIEIRKEEPPSFNSAYFIATPIFVLMISRNESESLISYAFLSMEDVVERISIYNISPNLHISGQQRKNELENYTFTVIEIQP